MPELNKQEIRSPEMQEVMSEIPGSFLRWGLFLFFGIIMAIVAVSYFINYPDIVTAPVTITTYNSPASLVTRASGKIANIFIGNEEEVTENQAIALIANQAVWSDVKTIDSFIARLNDTTSWQKVVRNSIPPTGLSLGEMQSSYIHFITIFHQFQKYLEQAYIPSKLILLEKQVNRQEEYITELLNQKALSEEDLQLSVNSFKRDSLLHVKSDYSISINQLEKSKQALLQKQVSFSSLKSSIKNNESSILTLKETLLDLKIQYENEMNKYRLDLNEAVQLLKISIGQWKEKYLVESPVNGKITFTSFWNENQVIKAGDVFATVIPSDSSKIIVRASVAASGLGKVRVGQEVNIKLAGFPFMEFGVIKGRIKSLSLVPVNETYIAEIDLVNGMRSSYNMKLNFVREMTGTADIITDNSRLIYRIIKPLKALGR
jgi:multidrug efflux pump subunit AcrA (membrane-fusion protein)